MASSGAAAGPSLAPAAGVLAASGPLLLGCDTGAEQHVSVSLLPLVQSLASQSAVSL